MGLATKLDTLGFKSLDQAGRVEFLTLPGAHMKFSRVDFKGLIDKYLAGPSVNLNFRASDQYSRPIEP